MPLELLVAKNLQEVSRGLGKSAYSMGKNMLARVRTPVLADDANLWNIRLDSITQNHYGSLNKDNRPRFKIDHEPDLGLIVNAAVNPDGSISTSQQAYEQSSATEFVIILWSDLNGATADYAIRADKYEAAREQIGKGRRKAEDLEKVGGFKINQWLKPEEVIRYGAKNADDLTLRGIKYVHEGWLELAVGKCNATKKEYLEAAKLLAKYAAKAQEEGCFIDGTGGMGFFVNTDLRGYKVRLRFLGESGDLSYSDDRGIFQFINGQFLGLNGAGIGCRAQRRG